MKKQIIKALALVCALALIFSGCDLPVSKPQGGETDPNTPVIETKITYTSAELDYAKFVAALYENYEVGVAYPSDSYESDYSIFGNNYYSFAFGWLREKGLVEKYLEEPAYSYKLDGRVLQNIVIMSFKQYELYDTSMSYYYGVDYQTPNIELREVAFSEDENEILKITYDRYADDYYLGTRVSYYFEKVDKENNIPEQYEEMFTDMNHMVRLAKVENEDRQKFYTEPKTVEISNKEEFLQFANTVNNGRYDEQLCNFVLTADIDLGGEEFTPIGMNNSLLDKYDWRDNTLSGFSGTLDGGGHTITGLSIKNPPEQNGYSNAGLFWSISSEGTVKNLNIKDAYVDSTAVTNSELMTNTGILAGSSNGTLINCHVSGEVKGYYNVGGLAGHISAYDYVAPYISDCSVEAVVSGSNSVGGFAGTLHGIEVNNCYFLGTVYAVPDEVYGETPHAIGGFSGYAIVTNISNCASSAEIKTLVSSSWVASFIGYKDGSLYNCYYDSTLSNWKGVAVPYPNQQYVYSDYELEGLPHAEILAKIKNMALSY